MPPGQTPGDAEECSCERACAGDPYLSATRRGGTRVYGPMAVDDHMQTGAFRDPAGNLFGAYHHGAH